MLDRGDYWQCAFVIPKGGYDELRRRGLPSLRDTIAAMVPFLHDRVGELADWDAVKLLTVKIDRLREWQRPGLLCIGDAAHAMSPLAASASTWPSRMPWRRPTGSSSRCDGARSRSTICGQCSAGATFPPARRSGSRC